MFHEGYLFMFKTDLYTKVLPLFNDHHLYLELWSCFKLCFNWLNTVICCYICLGTFGCIFVCVLYQFCNTPTFHKQLLCYKSFHGYSLYTSSDLISIKSFGSLAAQTKVWLQMEFISTTDRDPLHTAFIATFPLAWYDWNIVERAVKPQFIHMYILWICSKIVCRGTA